MHKAQRLINHVALVLDGSSSMSSHKSNLIKVADEQIKHLALRSEELSQETRVSVYLFADNVECLIFDMDVMRLPSIADLYRANGMTALIAAAVKSQEDLETTSQLYGDHAFLTFVLTDGMENVSDRLGYNMTSLSRKLYNAPENWTVGFLVPDSQGSAYLTRIGVDPGSIALWDASSAKGLADSFSTIRTATDNFMAARATGVRGTRSVFSTGTDVLNKKTVTGTLKQIPAGNYSIHNVQIKSRIDEFVKNVLGLNYSVGMGYYQLTKTETIQPQKNVIVREKATGKVYGGAEARNLIGLPNMSVRVKPDDNPDYEVYVQSTSLNRNLMPGTKLLIKK